MSVKKAIIAEVIIFILAAGLLAATVGVQAQTPQQELVWRRDAIPVGAKVVCMQVIDGEVILQPAIMTDYAGLWEYSLNERPVHEVRDYMYWAYLPGGREP